MWIAAASVSHLTDSPWFAIGVPMLVAVVGLSGTVWVTRMNLRARRREIDDDRDEQRRVSERDRSDRLAREQRDRADHEREQRASALEEITEEISQYAAEMNALIQNHKGSGPQTIPFPPAHGLIRGLSKLTSRANLPQLFEAATAMIQQGRKLPMEQYPLILGILQERLDLWYVGWRDLDATLEAMREDAQGYAAGKIPEHTDEFVQPPVERSDREG